MAIWNSIVSALGLPGRTPFPLAPLDAGEGKKLWEVAAATVNASPQGYVDSSKQQEIPQLGEKLFKTAYEDGRLSGEEQTVLRKLLFSNSDAGPIYSSLSERDRSLLYSMTTVAPAVGSLVLKMAATGEPLTSADVLWGVEEMAGKREGAGDLEDLKRTAERFPKPVSEETAAYLEAATTEHFGREFQAEKGGQVRMAPHWSENPFYEEAAAAIDAIRGVTPPPAQPADAKAFRRVVDGLREEIQGVLAKLRKGEVVHAADVDPGALEWNGTAFGSSLDDAYFTHVPKDAYQLFGRALSLANRSVGYNGNVDLTYFPESAAKSTADLEQALKLLGQAEQAVSGA